MHFQCQRLPGTQHMFIMYLYLYLYLYILLCFTLSCNACANGFLNIETYYNYQISKKYICWYFSLTAFNCDLLLAKLVPKQRCHFSFPIYDRVAAQFAMTNFHKFLSATQFLWGWGAKLAAISFRIRGKIGDVGIDSICPCVFTYRSPVVVS